MASEDCRHRLRILHISDLHERAGREAERWRRWRVVQGDPWERNLAALMEDGPVDLVCFTGDAAVAAIIGFDVPDNADGAADALSRWAGGASPAGLPPIILVDELDGMLERFEHRFFERLRGMLGRVVFVVATRDSIDLI